MSSPSSSASISTRAYIYFLPYPLPPQTPVPYTTSLPFHNPLNYPKTTFEPTHTLVLTSPRKTFIDIRLFKPTARGEPEMPSGEHGVRERLHWAFAGTALSEDVKEEYSLLIRSEGANAKLERKSWAPGEIRKAQWIHWVDSEYAVGTPTEEIPVDEGLMFPISATKTLEHGHGVSSSTGQMQSYEEMWDDLPVKVVGAETTKLCVVLRLSIEHAKIRGLVIRLGQYCQGMIVSGSNVTIERWEYNNGISGHKEDWERVARIGDLYVPCAFTFQPEFLQEGMVVKYFDYEWTVEEKMCWN